MISVVMPTHKKMPYLFQTVMSVLTQDASNYELIVVDASPEKYFARYFEENIVKNEQDYCKNVKIYEPTEKCKYPGAMKMYGLKRTSCGSDDYVVFLDHDDFLVQHALRCIEEATVSIKADMVSGHYVSAFVGMDCNIYKNSVTYMNGEDSGKTINKITFGNRYIEFPFGLQIYEQRHRFVSNLLPIVYKKKTFEDRRMFFVEDTECMDDATKHFFNPFLSEAYIDYPLYCYNAYAGGITNSTNGSPVSETAAKIMDVAIKTNEVLTKCGYIKERTHYTPTN